VHSRQAVARVQAAWSKKVPLGDLRFTPFLQVLHALSVVDNVQMCLASVAKAAELNE
jgi:hypothetical protein